MPYIGNAPYQGSIASVNIIDGTIDTADLKDGSVTNSKLGSVTTTYIGEGISLYYTDARARAAHSFTAGSGAQNSTTGVITIPTNTTHLTNGSNYITLSSLSFTAGSGAYNNTTGVITIPTNNNQLINGSGYITGNQTITLSGDISGSGTTGITATLASVGTAGTYTKVTTDSKGRITSGTTLSSGDLPTYTGSLTSTQITNALGFTPSAGGGGPPFTRNSLAMGGI